jgi:hypothetical protein
VKNLFRRIFFLPENNVFFKKKLYDVLRRSYKYCSSGDWLLAAINWWLVLAAGDCQLVFGYWLLATGY